MRKLIVRVTFAALAATLRSAAQAHEFTCEEVAGVVQVDASGLPVIGWAALPVFASQASSVLTLRSYPAIVGFRVGIHNVAAATSVVTGVTDAFTAGLTAGRDYSLYGLFDVGPGFSLAPGGSAYLEYGIRVASQEDCLGRFGAGASGAPVCTDTGEDRFVVTHDAGSTECRARIVCGAPEIVSPPMAGPPPPPACPSTWHGVLEIPGGPGDYGELALHGGLDQSCDLHLAASVQYADPNAAHGIGSDPEIVSLTPSGARYRTLRWTHGYGNWVSADLVGNLYLAWSSSDHSSIKKLEPSGTQIWEVPITDFLFAEGFTVDAAGHSYVAGNWDAALWVAKLDTDGTRRWTQRIEVPGQYTAGGVGSVAVDADGNVLAAGNTTGSFPGHPNAGCDDVLVAKFGPDGNVLWVQLFGGTGCDLGYDVTPDGAGGAYVVGTGGAFSGAAASGDTGAFLARLDAAGNVLWVRRLAPGLEDWPTGVATDAAGNAWVVGWGLDPLPGQPAYGSYDAWVVKYDPAGTQLFAHGLGTSGSDTASDILLDAGGDAFVIGYTYGDFAGGPASGSARSTFVAKFDPLGNLQ